MKKRKTLTASLSLATALALVLVPAAHAFIYWGDVGNNRIGRANNDGTGVDPNFIQAGNQPSALAVDGAHIYWVNSAGNSIGRANVDGSGVESNFIAGIEQPEGIAVNAQSIFWTTAKGLIGRADIDGATVNKDFITQADVPCGVAVDSGHIWWVDDRLAESTIGRAGLDGAFVQPNYAEIGSAFPCGLTVNSASVYWSDTGFLGGGSLIGRVDVATGKSVDQSFIAGGSAPCGIALDSASHLYWANEGSDAIARADSDGTAVDQSFIETGGTHICGVAVDDLALPPAPSGGGGGGGSGGAGAGTGGGTPDTTSPTTTITAGPGKKLAQGRAKLSFRSSEPDSTFTCKLDRQKPEPCTSPKTYKGLKRGRHTFKVWATDAAGNKAAAPAKRTFKVPADR
jgi:streptogramin lyase